MTKRRALLQCAAVAAIAGRAGVAEATSTRAYCPYEFSAWGGIQRHSGNVVRCKGCGVLGAFTVENHDDGSSTYTLTAPHQIQAVDTRQVPVDIVSRCSNGHHAMLATRGNGNIYWVVCIFCGAFAPPFSTAVGAVNAWNNSPRAGAG